MQRVSKKLDTEGELLLASPRIKLGILQLRQWEVQHGGPLRS